MMLLHLLLHVLIFHLLTAKGGPRDSENRPAKSLTQIPVRDPNYVIKWIEQCPDIGYYFKREPAPNSIDPGACYLCFCHGKHKAVCWRRENRRCNVDSYWRRGFGKRDARILDGSNTGDIRVRRSPAFSDIFFRDASRDAFNKNTAPDQCKPYESSFSDDCPPADWCIGCTVCDCDANGRWDCHILSFCHENKKGKSKSYKGPSRKTVKKKPIPKTTARTKSISNNRKLVTPKHIFKKPASAKENTQRKKAVIRYQKISPKAYTTRSVKFIKKTGASHNPVELKGNKVQKLVKKHNNNTVLVAQQVIKKVMAAVHQMIQKEMFNMTKIVTEGKLPVTKGLSKTANKRKDIHNPKSKPTPRPKSKSIYHKSTERKVNKRQINKEQNKPIMWQRRLKRSVISKGASSSTTSTASMDTQEVKPIETTMISVENTSNSTRNNLLATDYQNFTQGPLPIIHEKEYYKYEIATDKASQTKLPDKNLTVDNTKRDKMKEYITELNKPNYEGTKLLKTTIANNDEFLINITESNNKKQDKNESVLNIKTITSGNNVVFNNHLNYLAPYKLKENEMKYNEWLQKTFIREKIQRVVGRPKNMFKLVNASTEVASYKNKVHSKDVDRIDIAKRYKVVKMRNRNRCPLLYNLYNRTDAILGTKKSTLQDILIELLKRYHNDTQKPKKIFRKFNVIRYLKKFFGAILRRQNNSQQFNTNHIIETLCENFGPCGVLDIRDNKLLKSKLVKLNHETIKILKTVKIIKGLLKLLDGITYSSDKLSKEENFRNDMHKLSNILKYNYTSHYKISETQLTQINYIKKNTDSFVKSVKNFATILNDIITILTQSNNSSSTTDRKVLSKRFTEKYPFQNLKYLLLKYNLIQNIFMQKIIGTLNSFENIIYNKSKVSAVQDLNNSIAIEHYSSNVPNNLKKLRHLIHILNFSGRNKREARDGDAIEYLLMLMEYLLKQNHSLDASPVNDGIDLLIDAIKNAPDIKIVRKKVLDNTSLLELETTTITTSRRQQKISIKNLLVNGEKYLSSTEKSSNSNIGARNNTEYNFKIEGSKDLFDMVEEDKETIEKFQFDRRAQPIPDFITTTDTTATTIEDMSGLEILDTDKQTKHPSNKLTYNNGNIIDNINVANIDNVSIYNLNTESSITYNRNDYNDYTGNGHKILNIHNNNYIFKNFIDVTQSSHNDSDNSENINNLYESSYNIDNDLHRAKITTNKNNFVNVESTTIIIDRILAPLRQESYMNTEEGIVKKSTSEELEEKETISVPKTQPQIKHTKTTKSIKFRTLDSYDDSESLDKKSQLEWIEANFGREDKFREEKNNLNKTINLKPNRTEAPKNYFQSTANLDFSFISKEAVESNKSNIKATADELMLKKQMDLLNSLDYGTERGEFDEVDTKDDNREEAFSTYYV